jgi:nicotinate-nucleotide adenylyltransferase
MRVALFGGSFDPPHRGHLAIARAAADAFALDRVFFAPAGVQPLKRTITATSFADRLAMTTLACETDPRFAPSDLDAPRSDSQPNYTVQTLAALARLHPEATLFNLAGADSFQDIGRWREPAELLRLAEWIVVSRPGYTLADPADFPLTPAQRSRVHLLDAIHDDVSATELRERLAQGGPCTELLPESVAAYIAVHHLYHA